MVVLVLTAILFIGLIILMGETMYFNHKEKIEKMKLENKEKMEKIKLESNPLNKIFSGNKKDEERKDGRQ